MRWSLSGWVLVAAVAPSPGFVFVGNPVAKLRIDRPAQDLASAEVTVERVRLHACGGGATDFWVEQEVDLTEELEVAVAAGDWCGLSVAWGGEGRIEGPSWVLSHDEPTTSVEIDSADPVSAPLTPFTVVSGSFSGNAPRLYVRIE